MGREVVGGQPQLKPLRDLVAAVIDAGGLSALQVADKPELERRLVELARPTD